MNAVAPVHVSGDVVRATSIDVALSFDKRHAHVLRSISALVKSRPDLQPNFGLLIDNWQAGKGATRQRHYYEMDRKGFVLLAMGFTGPKALEWKIAYIDAFDRMEAVLRATGDDGKGDDDLLPPVTALGDLSFVDRLKYEPPTIQLAYVREMRMARGRTGAIAAMRDLGWEDDDDGAPAALLAASNPVIKQVLQWVQDRTTPQPGHRVRTMTLYNDFVRYCGGLRMEVLSLTAFGRSLGALGYPSRRSNTTYRDGLKLRP